MFLLEKEARVILDRLMLMKLHPRHDIFRFLALCLGVVALSASAFADEKGRTLLLRAESAQKKVHCMQAEVSSPNEAGKTVFRALRPGFFSLVSGNAVGHRTVITYDGGQVLESDEENKTCTTLDAAGLFEMGNVAPSMFLIAAFLEPALLPQMEAPTYLGPQERNGKTFEAVKCAATTERSAWTLFFNSDGALAGVESEEFQLNSAHSPAERVWLSNVQLDPPLKEGDFKYELPAGVQVTKSDSPVNELLPLHSLAPSFTVPTADGKTVTLDSILKGKKAVLLTITFAECGACMLEVPTLKRLHAGLKDKGLAILAVNIVDSRAEAQKVIDKYQFPYPVALDNKAGGGTDEISRRYNATAGGLNILVGADKKIVWEEAGLNEKHLRCVLERMGIAAINR